MLAPRSRAGVAPDEIKVCPHRIVALAPAHKTLTPIFRGGARPRTAALVAPDEAAGRTIVPLLSIQPRDC